MSGTGCGPPVKPEAIREEVLATDPGFSLTLSKRDELANRLMLLERELDLKRTQVEQQVAGLRKRLGEARQQAVHPAHDAAGHRLIEADGRADRQHLVTHPQRGGVTESRRRRRRHRLEADQRDVEHGIEADDPGAHLDARAQRRRERGGAVDDVGIGQHLPITLDHHTGAHHGLEATLGPELVDLHRLNRHH